MEIILNDSEIRTALARAIEEKLDDAVTVTNPSDCWFEAKAGLIEGGEISDIHAVRFVFDTTVSN